MNSKGKTAECTTVFVSAWDKREKALRLVEDDSFDLYMANDELGVVQTSPSDVCFRKEQAAILFGASSEELVFRASFDCFVKINVEEEKHELRERLYKSRFATFSNISDPFCTKNEHGIPVCLDALSMVPQSTETEMKTEADDEPEDAHVIEPELDNKRRGKARENETLTDIERSIPYCEEIQNAIDELIVYSGGNVYVRFRPRDNSMYPDDFVVIGDKFFVIVFANISGTWLADEEVIHEKPPLWYSETGFLGSPVFQAMKRREDYSRELPDIRIDSIVVLPEDCVICNEEDMLECWENECHTAVVRTVEIDKSVLQSLLFYLASLPADTTDAPQLDALELNRISIRFTNNLKYKMKAISPP